MQAYSFAEFGLDNLKLHACDPPDPGPREVVIDVKALSLNRRDLMVIQGTYNPKLRLPATPISDAAGVVSAVGPGVERVSVGDRVVSHFVSDWIDGPFKAEYGKSTLGTPGPGMAAEQVVLPEHAVVSMSANYDFAQAATLPIAALTAWSALVTVGNIRPGQTVLTLGTGGVSVCAVQLARAMRAQVIITSSSDEKLQRTRELGATHTVNYRTQPDWDAAVMELTDGRGADLTIETAGPGTLQQSMRATKPGGTIAFLGALTGLTGKLNLAPLMMNRLHLAGIFVDSRAAFEQMNGFIAQHNIKPVIDRTFLLEAMPDALRFMEAGAHLGKIVVELG